MPGTGDTLLSWLVLARRAPGYAPFLPLLWRSLAQPKAQPSEPSRVPGNLTPDERAWLAEQVRRTPDGAVILQAGPIAADVTCALAAGCWASQRHVFALWPDAEGSAPARREWHRTVITQGLGPYVTRVREPRAFERRMDLLFGEAGPWLTPGSVWIQQARADSGAEFIGQCNTLTAIQVPSNLQAPP